MSQDSDKKTFATMDLAQKIAMVKPTDSKGATVQTQQAFRTLGQPQVRMITVPSGSVQTSSLMQTHLLPQTMIKQGNNFVGFKLKMGPFFNFILLIILYYIRFHSRYINSCSNNSTTSTHTRCINNSFADSCSNKFYVSWTNCC